MIRTCGDATGKMALIEKKLANKEDLKMTDLLRCVPSIHRFAPCDCMSFARYYVADGQAAKDLLYRRIKVNF